MANQPQNDNVPPLPNEATQQTLAEHATRQILNQARDYAKSRVKLLRELGRVTSSATARELVEDAYADTWMGIEEWHPATCSLLVHLRGVILKRTWREIRHVKKRFFVPIQTVNSNISPRVERALANAVSSEVEPAELRSLLASVCEQLKARVADDHEAALLECWTAGRFGRDEIATVTGFDRTIYDRTRKRLMYKARHLSIELQVAARNLLRTAS